MSERHKLPADYPMGYRGLVLNGHRNASGELVRANLEDCIEVTTFDFSPLAIRDQIEGLHLASGADVGLASKEYRRLALRGWVKGSTASKLEDRVSQFLNAFDIEDAQFDSPTTEGVSAFDFYCPSDSPPSGYTSPVHELFNARPLRYPIVYERKSQGLSYMFAAELVCPDPRRYVYSQQAISLNAGNSWASAMPNWQAGMGVMVYPYIYIELAGAGQSTFTISDGTTALVLDLSSAGAGWVTVNMETQEIIHNSAPAAYLRSSDVDTFFGVPAGGATWYVQNANNINYVSLYYRPARS